jgi:cytochrome c oxidase assembly factor 2
MPPHLHPRSRMTTSLFTTTLMVSFLVVAAPHLIPCPVDPRTLTDSVDPVTGEIRRRRRRKLSEDNIGENAVSEQSRRQKLIEEKLSPKRECPVPKPGGLIGQVLGWKEADRDAESVSITSRVEKARRETQSKNDDQ